ncbi:MAG: T9SS type A sorting domain-containing protein [Flavobacteriales bacterium]|nr:T9SS type A sorting domain-containing protein [Flavobacteriales bacterium]
MKHSQLISVLRQSAAVVFGSVVFGHASLAQEPVLFWEQAIDCNALDHGALRPRIALNANNDPVVLWGDNSPMANHVAVGNGAAFNAPVQLSTGFMPAIADWMGSSIASAGNSVWVVMKAAPEESMPIYVRRSDDGGFTWGDTMRVEPLDGLVSRFPSIDVSDSDAPVVQYMQFDGGFAGARQVVTRMMGGAFMTPVQVSTPFLPGNVCDCCPNQIIADPDHVVALYRNAGSDVRVICGASSTDDGASFPFGSVVDTTGWVLAACPSSGPDGYLDGDSVRFVWMSGANNGTKVYLGSALATDLTLGEQYRLHAGQPMSLQQNFPRIAGSGDTLGVVWQQTMSGQSEILFSWSTTGVLGLSEPDTVNIDLAGAQKTPDIAYSNGAFHIVWSEAGLGQVRYRKAVIGTSVGLLPVTRRSELILLWPNPASTEINIPLRYITADVTDAEGSIVMRNAPLSGGVVDVNSLPTGHYIIAFTAADKSRAVGHFVKQ